MCMTNEPTDKMVFQIIQNIPHIFPFLRRGFRPSPHRVISDHVHNLFLQLRGNRKFFGILKQQLSHGFLLTKTIGKNFFSIITSASPVCSSSKSWFPLINWYRISAVLRYCPFWSCNRFPRRTCDTSA